MATSGNSSRGQEAREQLLAQLDLVDNATLLDVSAKASAILRDRLHHLAEHRTQKKKRRPVRLQVACNLLGVNDRDIKYWQKRHPHLKLVWKVHGSGLWADIEELDALIAGDLV